MDAKERREGEQVLKELNARASAWWGGLSPEERRPYLLRDERARLERLVRFWSSIDALGLGLSQGAGIGHALPGHGYIGAVAAGFLAWVGAWWFEGRLSRRVRELPPS